MIIQPQGKPAIRIRIEVDTKGQARITAEDVILANVRPVHPAQVALILSQLLTATITGMIRVERSMNGSGDAETEDKKSSN